MVRSVFCVLLLCLLPAVDLLEAAGQQELRLFIHQHPGSLRARWKLSTLLIKDGEWGGALSVLDELRKLRPGDYRIHYRLGIAYSRLGKLASARDAFCRGLELAPGNKKLLDALARTRAELRKKTSPIAIAAFSYFEKERFRDAGSLCDRLLAIDPDNTRGILLKGLIFHSFGRSEEAARFFERVLELDQNNGVAAARLAYIEIQQRRMKEAGRHLAVAAANAPDEVYTHMARAEFFAVTGDYLKALEEVDLVIARKPSELSYVLKFNYCLLLKQFDKAFDTLEGLRLNFPKLSVLPYLDGRLQLARGDEDKALGAFLDYIGASGGKTGIAVNALAIVAGIYEHKEKYRLAQKTILKALAIKPYSPELQAERSNIAEKWRLKISGKKTVRGAFVFLHEASLPGKVFNRISTLFQNAWRVVCPSYGRYPRRVSVLILKYSAGVLPAFFDIRSKQIVVSREFFENEGEERFGRQVVFHEFSHFVLSGCVDAACFMNSNLWIIEGLAEYHASAHHLSQERLSFLFGDGMLNYPELSNYLAVQAVGSGSLRLKAYVQAAFMVEVVVRSFGDGACGRLIGLMKDSLDGHGMEEAFRLRLGLSRGQLLLSAQELIRSRSSKFGAVPE